MYFNMSTLLCNLQWICYHLSEWVCIAHAGPWLWISMPALVLNWGFRRPGLKEVDTPLVLSLWPWNSFKHRHTHIQTNTGTPLSPISPQLSTASRFQSGLSQQTEGIIYAGKQKGTSRRGRDLCVFLAFLYLSEPKVYLMARKLSEKSFTDTTFPVRILKG